MLHSLGFVHNDLKLENIVVGDKNNMGLRNIRLIDFGYASAIVRDPCKTDFCGNLAFASKYALRFQRTSQRDDLISLAYILVYLHKGQLSFS
jgi:serine/threonine protein kinase